ncbi:MAG TPA: acyltransferase [Albitalea sp.]|nr:acyltransferase [Albitalea sp.]
MKVSPAFSTYLDLLRLSAAAMVAVTHIKLLGIGPDAVRRLIPAVGHEFVIIFFVLSGFVIAYTVDRKRDATLRDYALDRAARIYSVVVPALLLATLVSVVHWTLAEPGQTETAQQIGMGLVANLFFFGQSWWVDSVPPSDPPFWSLCYEVMYYLLFGCMHYLRGGRRVWACLAVVLLAGPKVLLLLPCWLAGVAVYRWSGRLRSTTVAAAALCVAPMVILLVLSRLHLGGLLQIGPGDATETFISRSNNFIKDFICALMIAVHLCGMQHLLAIRALRRPAARTGDAAWWARLITQGAGATFTLYLIHYPLLLVVLRVAGTQAKSVGALVAALSVVAITTWVVAQHTEAQRHRLRIALARFANPVARAV